VIIRGPGRIDVKLGGANVFIAPVTAGDGEYVAVTPYQGLDHFGLAVKDHGCGGRRDQGQGVEFTRSRRRSSGVRICFMRTAGISVEATGARPEYCVRQRDRS